MLCILLLLLKVLRSQFILLLCRERVCLAHWQQHKQLHIIYVYGGFLYAFRDTIHRCCVCHAIWHCICERKPASQLAWNKSEMSDAFGMCARAMIPCANACVWLLVCCVLAHNGLCSETVLCCLLFCQKERRRVINTRF